MPKYVVPRNGDVDLVFDGVCLVDKSSRRDGANYWTEIRVYRTAAGRYVAESVGCSALGDAPRRNVTVVEEPAQLRDALKRRRRAAGAPSATPRYLTAFALEALREAAEQDQAVSAALVESV